jgi:hypothetical protein
MTRFFTALLFLIDVNSLVPYTDVVCYVLAAIMTAIFLFIYIPTSVLYIKADKAIARSLADQEEETHPENQE